MEKIARLKENWKAKSNGKRETEKKREKLGKMKEISEEEARWTVSPMLNEDEKCAEERGSPKNKK